VLGHEVADVVGQRELAGAQGEGDEEVAVHEVVAAEGDEHQRAATRAGAVGPGRPARTACASWYSPK
jgi:hypothetical protein